MSSTISFISALEPSGYRSLTSLDRFISRYFILFDVIVNGIVFLNPLSDILLLVYRNATDLCILLLYPENLPKSLMSSSNFLVTLGFSMYSALSSVNSDCFNSSFIILISFIYFFLSDCFV